MLLKSNSFPSVTTSFIFSLSFPLFSHPFFANNTLYSSTKPPPTAPSLSPRSLLFACLPCSAPPDPPERGSPQPCSWREFLCSFQVPRHIQSAHWSSRPEGRSKVIRHSENVHRKAFGLLLYGHTHLHNYPNSRMGIQALLELIMGLTATITYLSSHMNYDHHMTIT